MLSEVEEAAGEIVLFIDEIHTVVGAGAGDGAMDAGNLLKPALARGELRCVGATTLDEYRKYIEKDAALERRFQQVHVRMCTLLSGASSRYMCACVRGPAERRGLALALTLTPALTPSLTPTLRCTWTSRASRRRQPSCEDLRRGTSGTTASPSQP